MCLSLSSPLTASTLVNWIKGKWIKTLLLKSLIGFSVSLRLSWCIPTPCLVIWSIHQMHVSHSHSISVFQDHHTCCHSKCNCPSKLLHVLSLIKPYKLPVGGS